MCVKFPHEYLNPDPCPPHPTSIYTCRVITAPRVCGGLIKVNWISFPRFDFEFISFVHSEQLINICLQG